MTFLLVILSAVLFAGTRTTTAFTALPTSANHNLQTIDDSTTSLLFGSTSSDSNDNQPFAVVVQAEIQPSRLDEFRTLIATNANNSRQEPGCLRFDVLTSVDHDNQFWFYELYQNQEAVDFHKQQAHYQLWADFKESGGVLSSTSYKAHGELLTE